MDSEPCTVNSPGSVSPGSVEIKTGSRSQRQEEGSSSFSESDKWHWHLLQHVKGSGSKKA